MTDQKKAEVIGRAARALYEVERPFPENDPWTNLHESAQQPWRAKAMLALEAVGFFELMEAAERIRYVNFRSENYLIAWSALDTAITKAKAQTNDTHTD